LQRYPKNYGKRVKDNPDQDSWFSAKPIIVGSLSNILVGTELNLIQDVNYHRYFLWNTFFICKHRGIVKILSVSM